MSAEIRAGQEKDWICNKCDLPLRTGLVDLAYWGITLSYDLPKCPKCGLVFVSEEMATIRMTEVEQSLEDK